MENKHLEATALLLEKDQKFESKLNDIRAAHVKDMKSIHSKDEEIARLNRVLEETCA